jgi:hypothetical protein
MAFCHAAAHRTAAGLSHGSLAVRRSVSHTISRFLDMTAPLSISIPIRGLPLRQCIDPKY